MNGDPAGMRALAAFLTANAERSADIAQRCRASYEQTVFEGPAARRIDDRVDKVARDVIESAEALRDLAARLNREAAHVEEEQHLLMLRRQREEEERRAEEAKRAARANH